MCGIAGIYRAADRPPPEEGDLAVALGRMAHRGPDGQGTFRAGGLALGHRRLAIVDREGGAQPMLLPDRTAVLALNGEVHDYEERRAGLLDAGIDLSGRSDTEVLLHHLSGTGAEGLREVHGMYALALFEPGGPRLTLARDPFGVKPLLYAVAPGEIRFASELPALLALGGPRPRLDLDALSERLAFGVPLSDRTLVRGVFPVPPGVALTAGRDAEPRLTRFHEVRYGGGEERPEAEWIGLLREALLASVRPALRSDVPLGAALSGGMDSSLVAALAARESGTSVPAYTGWFDEGGSFDERPHARAAAAEAGLRGVEVEVGPADLRDRLRELARRLEGPIAGPGSLPQLVVAGRAAQDVRVLLTGQGADETFGGYVRQHLALLASEGRLDPASLPAGFGPYRPLAERIGPGRLTLADAYYRTVYRADGAEGLLGPVLREAFEEYDPRAEFGLAFREEDGDPWHRMLSFERRTLLPALLHVEDRVSMARSIESRVPLLSPALTDLAARVPAEIAFRAGEPKRALRLAAEGLAPPSALARRDKMGFPVPLSRWARGPLREDLLRVLADGPLVPEGILAPGAPERLVGEAGGQGRLLWFFLLLSEWMAATGVRP